VSRCVEGQTIQICSQISEKQHFMEKMEDDVFVTIFFASEL